MNAVLRLNCEEPVQLDRAQLDVLFRSLGPVAADLMLNQALEELAGALSRAARQYRDGRLDDLRDSLRVLIRVARQVGMAAVARVARDVLDLSQDDDAAAFGATMARLQRIGESALVAAWDLQDLPV